MGRAKPSYSGASANPRQPRSPLHEAANHLRLVCARFIGLKATAADVLEGCRIFEDASLRPKDSAAKALAFVLAERAKIDADERHHYKPALVQINAPLALIQTALTARDQALESVEKILRGEEP